MLDFHRSKLDSETQSRTTQIHHGDALGDLIARAAASLGLDKSVFLRAAIEREASRVLEASSQHMPTHVLTKDDAARFAAALDAAPAPTPRARAAAKASRARVVHAD